MKNISQKDLLIYKLLNALDRLAYHSYPVEEWDGQLFSEALEDFPMAATVPNSVEEMFSRERSTTIIVPQVVLAEVWEAVAGNENGDPGLQDYYGGDWEEQKE